MNQHSKSDASGTPRAQFEGHIGNLDIMRAVAALAVCFCHFAAVDFLNNGSVSWVLNYGFLGVQVFFVVSGFVIPMSLYRSRYSIGQLPQFMVRRFLRLYPAFVVSVALTVTILVVASATPWFGGERPSMSLKQLVANVTLSSDLTNQSWFNGVYWTLAIEAQYYLLIGLVLPLIVHAAPLFRGATILIWLLLPLLLPIHASVFAHCALFGMGLLIFMHSYNLLGRHLIVPCLAAAAAVQVIRHDWVSAAAGLIAAVAIWKLPPINLKSLTFVGMISYSLYLIHAPFGGRIINLARRLPEDPWYRYSAFAFALFVSIGLAYLMYRMIEKPSHEYARKFSFKRSTRSRTQESLVPVG